ncbi:LacI family DNA-binding transcriptional regulator [Chitinophagaceae bacterium LWZ2-11]
MPVNLKTIAKELGLSISTVSKALKDSYEISEQTKAKVLALVKKLNYEPNPYASSLRKQKSKTIAVVIPEIANNFFALAINGIESVAQEKGYHVLIYLTHEDYQKEVSIMGHLQSGRVDGVLMSVSSNVESSPDHIMALKQRDIPVVFFDRIYNRLGTTKITTDDYDSGYKATEHLIEKGCKRIAFFAFKNYLSINNKRMQGYLDALQHYKIKHTPSLILQGGNDVKENYQLIKRLLNSKNPPDGIFAAVEKLALATYQVCNELGINIPKQLKVISFSNLETASLLKPAMTTITQPAFEIGEQAATALFKFLDKRNATIPDEHVIIPSVLVERESTR